MLTAGRADQGFTVGQVVKRYGYQAFGSDRFDTAPTRADVDRRFTGQIHDDDTDLYFYNARYYAPDIARFIQADTMFATGSPDSQSLNRYAYCLNNPLVFTDSTGHVVELLVAIAVGAALGAAQSAVYGGNVWQGMAFGALSGALGYFGGVGGFNFATEVLGWGAKSLGTAICVGFGAAASGALSATITGGDPGMSAITSGIGAGIGFRLGQGLDSLGGNALKASDRYFIELAASMGIGGLTGGVVAELQGGKFGMGFVHAVAWSAAGYVLSSILNTDADPNSLPPSQPSADAPQQQAESVWKINGVKVPVVDGKGQLTESLLFDIMKATYIKYLDGVSRNSMYTGKNGVKNIMCRLDSDLGKKYKANRFMFDGKEYSGEEVNYVGVGMGFKHFRILHVPRTPINAFGLWQENAHRNLMIRVWNMCQENPNLSTPGERYFAEYGSDNWSKVRKAVEAEKKASQTKE
ncbi:MAG: RHS repeat-associated core domain-containing protein [Sedimentisphaerales bacterium]|nr:RHS repeat-associated core domain-containing protein [Sedimentisphaerales bacterium]